MIAAMAKLSTSCPRTAKDISECRTPCLHKTSTSNLNMTGARSLDLFDDDADQGDPSGRAVDLGQTMILRGSIPEYIPSIWTRRLDYLRRESIDLSPVS